MHSHNVHKNNMKHSGIIRNQSLYTTVENMLHHQKYAYIGTVNHGWPD